MFAKVRAAWFAHQATLQRLIPIVAALMVAVILLAPDFVHAQTPELSLEIDPSPLFASISTYVPLFFGILAVAGGILIGKKIAEFVIKSIADAF